MKDPAYQATLAQLRMVNTLVIGAPSDEDLEAFIAANEKAEVLGPLLDPTAWMRSSEALAALTASARALQVHRREIRQLALRLGPVVADGEGAS